jgi:hypothetical protein
VSSSSTLESERRERERRESGGGRDKVERGKQREERESFKGQWI